MNSFCGHPTRELDNGSLRLEYVTDVGPRIARLYLGRSDLNLLAEVPETGVDTPLGRFHFMGGHRLWHSPEAIPRTYIPDGSVTIENLPDGVRLSAAAEKETGMAKAMEIRLASDRAVVTIRHELINEGLWAVEFAPWCLTMFKMGGTAILPQAAGSTDPAGLLPDRQLVLWPYTRVRDARLLLDDDFILLKANAALPPCKIGYHNANGWAGYWLNGVLFIKRYDAHTGEIFPDNGCNTEVYCNDLIVEVESLGPLAKLQPGGMIVHQETWELYDSLDQPFIPDALKKRILQK
jgi:hypothetical protein